VDVPVDVSRFQFSEFELDCARFELRRDGRVVKLERIPMELLILLAERDGNVVPRREIIERLWGKDVFVDTEHGINTAIRKIRSALQEDAAQPRFVQTVPGKGYRFVAESGIHKTQTSARLDETITPEAVTAVSTRAGRLETIPPEVLPVKAVPPKHQVWWPAAIAILALCLVGGAALAHNGKGLRDLIIFAKNRNNIAHGVDPEVHDDYLRGRYLLGLVVAGHSSFTNQEQYGGHDALEAIEQFKQAIVKDPGFALAYAGLADAYIVLGNPVWGGHPPREALANAQAAASRAMELDPSLAEAHFSLAQTLEYDWNWGEAEKEYKLALKLNPNYADARGQYGRFLQALGRNDEAVTQMNYSTDLDPFGINTKVFVAYVTYASRRYDLAIKQFDSLGDDWGLVWAYRDKKMYPQAIAAWKKWERTHPSHRREPYSLATLAGIYGFEGKKREADKLIEELREASRHRYVSGVFFAEAYAGLGEKDQAIDWLERAYDEHDQWMVFTNSYPGLDSLRSEPRFKALMLRMNFPQ
jgi:DNA-binding winged helix-turn-helix (wHTH) protein/Tfp pilus assembly protein PilF